MGKKRYIKPEICEDSYILTVKAWSTTNGVALQTAATTTNVFAQTVTQSQTNVFVQESTVAVQTVATR